METPLLSLVVPVFDPPASALAATLRSIAAQTFGPFECVLVDDCSTRQDVRRELDRFVARDPRFRLVRRDRNGGIAAATNDGIDRARGEFVVFCDHDDLVHERALERIAAHLAAHPDDDVVYTDEQLVDEHGDLVAEYRKPAFSPVRLLGHNYLNHLVAVRRSTIGELRVRREFEPAQDYDFLLRVLERARGVGHVPEILYSWRAIAGSTALDAAEKPEVFASVLRTVQEHLDRVEPGAVAVGATTADGSATTAVRIERPSRTDLTATTVTIDSDDSAAGVDARVRATPADVVTLLWVGTHLDDTQHAALVATVTRPGVGAAGPRIVDSNGRFVDVGRVLRPLLAERFRGTPTDNDGPWGAFLVAREVDALAPNGFTIERAVYEDLGGLADDVSLDVAVAELCARLRSRGAPVVWTPNATIVHDDAPTVDAAVAERDLAVVRERVPEIDDEVYATDGRGLDAYHGDVPGRRVRRLVDLGLVDVVTCDVFDTLVTRPVATPSDLFVVLGRRLAERGVLPSHMSPLLFAGARRRAEERARHEVRRRAVAADAPIVAPECTLAAIYEHLSLDGWDTTATADELMAEELTVEADALRVVEPVAALLADVHARGIRTVLVSDSYLSSGQLGDLLARVGIDPATVDRIVTSSDHGLGKADGLLARVIGEESDVPSRVVHLGDNEVSDVAAAADAGAWAAATDVRGSARHVAELPVGLRDFSLVRATDGGVTAAVRAALTASEQLHDPAYQLGAATAGPAFAGFARWASATAAELGAESIHCLLREGATIAELMGQLAPDGPRPVAVHASRWVVARAAVLRGDADEVAVALARRRPFDADHVVTAFGVDPVRLRAVIGDGPWDLHATALAYEAIADDDELRGRIVEHAADLRARLVRYLDSVLELGAGGPLVLCDIGWGGTIQEGLTTVLRDAGFDRSVTGLYFALSAPGEDRLAGGADMRSYLPNRHTDPVAAASSRAVSHNADIAERLLTPRLGTLVDVDDHGSPVNLHDDHDHIPASLAAAQAGVRAFADALAGVPRRAPWADDAVWVADERFRAALAAAFADEIVTPSAGVAAALSTWPHDDVAGTHARAIAPEEPAELVRHLGAASIGKIRWTETAWPEGMAALVNPALSAQLGAVQAGADPEGLCPPAETGIARLAVFESGSSLAVAQDAEVPALGPAGWAVLRVATPVASVRSLRFDAGDTAALCDVADLAFVVELDDGTAVRRVVDDLTDPALVWVDAHPLDGSRFVARAGGHLIVPIGGEPGTTARFVRADVAFRTWRVDDASPLVATPLRHRLVAQQQRAVNVARRVGARTRRSTP